MVIVSASRNRSNVGLTVRAVHGKLPSVTTPREELEARLDRLEAEREIVRTLHRYAHSIDYGDEEAWLDCFTEEGAFDIRSHAHQLKRLVSGRDELRAFIAGHTRAPERWHKHLLVEPLVDVTGPDTATCRSYLAVVMDHEDVPVLRVFGRYVDQLERGADGRWRFRERVAEIESMRADLPPFVEGRPGRG